MIQSSWIILCITRFLGNNIIHHFLRTFSWYYFTIITIIIHMCLTHTFLRTHHFSPTSIFLLNYALLTRRSPSFSRLHGVHTATVRVARLTSFLLLYFVVLRPHHSSYTDTLTLIAYTLRSILLLYTIFLQFRITLIFFDVWQAAIACMSECIDYTLSGMFLPVISFLSFH